MSGGRTLVVAPYVGEFGWELMNWQGRVRWHIRRGGYQQVLVCARPDRRALYECRNDGTKVVFCPMPEAAWPGAACDDHRVDVDGRPYPARRLCEAVRDHVRGACLHLGFDISAADMLMPEFRSQLWPTSPTWQLFESLRRPGTVTTDIVLVPRHRQLAEERNQPADWWRALAQRLRDAGLTVEEYECHVGRAIVQLSRARLAVGASTGGLHLASLCGCPHYVWGSGPEARWTAWQMTNRQRYETFWNPLGTPCLYDECGWQPSLDRIFEQCIHALRAIGLKRLSTRAGRSAFRPRWALKRRLARLLEADGMAARWPWRVRQLMRERLV